LDPLLKNARENVLRNVTRRVKRNRENRDGKRDVVEKLKAPLKNERPSMSRNEINVAIDVCV